MKPLISDEDIALEELVVFSPTLVRRSLVICLFVAGYLFAKSGGPIGEFLRSQAKVLFPGE